MYASFFGSKITTSIVVISLVLAKLIPESLPYSYRFFCVRVIKGGENIYDVIKSNKHNKYFSKNILLSKVKSKRTDKTKKSLIRVGFVYLTAFSFILFAKVF